MLSLFNQSEPDHVCRAIRKPLVDFGGEWYTSEVMGIGLMALSYEGAYQRDPQIVRDA